MLSPRLRSVSSMLGRSSSYLTANFLRLNKFDNQFDNVQVATYSVLCRWSNILRRDRENVCVRGMCTDKKTWNEALRPKEKKSKFLCKSS